MRLSYAIVIKICLICRLLKGVVSLMETTDIVIHKGEKEEKYQLYVEDYVMSYLKNFGTTDSKNIFFYGTREQKNKKYYIYGAGLEKNISYFVRYELLEEITCRPEVDMPVFSVTEYSKKGDGRRYELAGYYIFYHANEAMQSYMIEQRKDEVPREKEDDKFKALYKSVEQSGSARSKQQGHSLFDGAHKKDANSAKIVKPNTKGKWMAIQLTAVFLILAAIIIGSTNSYAKLWDLGQSAIEVFFTMENQEAAKNSGYENKEEADGTVLRLEDIDAEFEKENRDAKESEPGTQEKEDTGESDAGKEQKADNSGNHTGGTAEENLGSENTDTENTDNGKAEEINAANSNEDEGNTANGKSDENNADNSKSEDGNAENGQSDESNAGNGQSDDSNAGNSNAENGSSDDVNAAESSEEQPQAQEAFARNYTEYYEIEKGDTLCNICIKLYGDASKVKEICEINKIEDPDNIKYGQKIILP